MKQHTVKSRVSCHCFFESGIKLRNINLIWLYACKMSMCVYQSIWWINSFIHSVIPTPGCDASDIIIGDGIKFSLDIVKYQKMSVIIYRVITYGQSDARRTISEDVYLYLIACHRHYDGGVTYLVIINSPKKWKKRWTDRER
jgi:hypothetical protein